MMVQLLHAAGVPRIERSREKATSLLPHSTDGKLLPLTAPLRCFKPFGPGVYTYMVWVKHMQPAFLIAFLLAIPAAVYNTTGGELRSIGPWTSTTLGNVRDVNATYGAIEVLVVLNFLVAMVRARDAVRKEDASMRDDEEEEAEADYTESESGRGSGRLSRRPSNSPQHLRADCTLLLSGVPAEAVDHAEVAQALGSFGEVTHCVVVLTSVRELVLRNAAREQLLEALASAKAEYYLAVTGTLAAGASVKSVKGVRTPSVKTVKPDAKRLAALRDAKEAAKAAFKAHADESEEIAQRTARGTGVAFATFRTPQEAKRCGKALQCGRHALVPSGDGEQLTGWQLEAWSTHRGAFILDFLTGGGGVLGSQPACEPSDVVWHNIGVGWWERAWRQLASISISLCTATVGSAGIAAVSYIKGHGYIAGAAHTSTLKGLLGLVLSLILALAEALPCIACNVLIFATVPILSERLERQRTFAGKEVSIALKLAFFQVYNTVLASLTFLLDPTVRTSRLSPLVTRGTHLQAYPSLAPRGRCASSHARGTQQAVYSSAPPSLATPSSSRYSPHLGSSPHQLPW